MTMNYLDDIGSQTFINIIRLLNEWTLGIAVYNMGYKKDFVSWWLGE